MEKKTKASKTQKPANFGYTVLATVPYQLCPKCGGQGTISKPPYVAGDVHEWTSSATSFTCDLCEGRKVIPMHIIPTEYKIQS